MSVNYKIPEFLYMTKAKRKIICLSHILSNCLFLPCEDGESHNPPTKCSHPPNNRRRVTFDPVVQERKMEADSDVSHQPVTLKEAADIVVRILDPFYKKGKFATKVSVRVSLGTFLYLWAKQDTK